MPLDADGWFPTGDLGRWLDDGRLHVDGRRGDLIITGGENVWPEAVEAALADHPDVAEVMVHGVDDPEWGQLVEAVIVPVAAPPTLESIRAHVKERHPASWRPAASRSCRHSPARRSANCVATALTFSSRERRRHHRR